MSDSSSSGGDRISNALREALFTGVIAAGLFVLLIGFKSDQNIRNELILVQRWGLFAIMVGLAMAGRFIMAAFIQPALAERKAAKAAAKVAETGEESWFKKNFSKLAIAFLLIYPPLILMLVGVNGSLKWVDNFGIQILIYVMLAWGLNIVVGLAGLLDLGYVAFYAVGAYSYALLSSYFGLSFWVLLPLAGILAAFWGIILGFPVLRLRGDYLAIVTLAFGEIIRLVLINWTAVTKGTFGISGIAKATLFGFYEFNATPTGFAAQFGLAQSSAYYKIFPLLSHPGPRAVDCLCHDQAAADADWPGMGGLARRRNRMPFTGHQHDDNQTDGICHRCRHWRLCRGVSLPCVKASSHRKASCSLNRPSFLPSLFWAAWDRSPALPSPHLSWSAVRSCCVSSISSRRFRR